MLEASFFFLFSTSERLYMINHHQIIPVLSKISKKKNVLLKMNEFFNTEIVETHKKKPLYHINLSR